MRIAFIVHDYRRSGGHGRYVYELANRFALEHDVHVFATQIEDRNERKITFHRVPSWRVRSITAILTFILPATFLRLKDFDIVHAQGLCGLRQDVTTAHFCQAAWQHQQEKCGARVSYVKRLHPWIVAPLEKFIFTKSRSRAVIAVSERMRQDLARFYRRSENVSVIYHGTDLDMFQPSNRQLWRAEMRAKLGIPEAGFLALYVGHLSKGAVPAIQAVLKVPDTFLLLVSSSDPSPYQALCESPEAKGRILFHPASAEIQRFYAAADVFLFPTLYDTFGLVITEAMAAGLPVLTSASAGAGELIEHGVSGVVVDPAWNVDGYAEWLRRLVADRSLGERMGAAGREKIGAFTWDKTAAETLAVYEHVLQEKRAAGKAN